MESVPSLGAPSRSIGDADSRAIFPTSWSSRALKLSSWMLVLGTIRVLCLSADVLLGLRDSPRANSLTMPGTAIPLGDAQVLFLLVGAWPLILGGVLWKTGWHTLVNAAAVTFLMLGAIGILEANLGWFHHAGSGVITIGSFHLSRLAIVHGSGPELILGFLGIAQILAETATGVFALRLGLSARSPTPDQLDHDAPRRARLGRLAVYASLAFGVLLIRVPAWSAYLEVITKSNWFRDYVINSDVGHRLTSPRNQGTQQIQPSEQETNLGQLLQAALQASNEHQYFAARDNYTRAVKIAESIPRSSARSPFGYTQSTSFNNLAWLLATCPDESIRDPNDAVRHAKRAIELSPKDGNFWNTLGVAYYRAGEWEEAKDALYRSMELRNEGDSFDWFFLCLVHLKLGDRKRAQDWYDRAVEWFHQSRSDDEELYRFHVEASALLGLPKPATPPPRPARQASPFGNGVPFPLQRRFRSRSAGFPNSGASGPRSHAPESTTDEPDPQVQSPSPNTSEGPADARSPKPSH